MPKTASEKCRLCAKLDITDVLLKHGPQGTNCFEGELCHKRRTYYGKRALYNRSRREKYRQKAGKTPQTIQIPLPKTTWAEVTFYRETKNSPTHAISLEVRRSEWDNKQKKMVERVLINQPPFHAKGMTEVIVGKAMREALLKFNEVLGTRLTKYEILNERHPSLCPICGR